MLENTFRFCQHYHLEKNMLNWFQWILHSHQHICTSSLQFLIIRSITQNKGKNYFFVAAFTQCCFH